MNIIKSDLVGIKYDQLWENTGDIAKDATVKPVLIIVGACEPESSEDLQLQKMLGACKLRLEQYNMIRLKEGEMAAWHRMRELLDPGIIFLIGVLPSQLGISALFNINVPNNFNEKIWLPTLSINELEQNADLKKQLWVNGMKPLFLDKPLQ